MKKIDSEIPIPLDLKQIYTIILELKKEIGNLQTQTNILTQQTEDLKKEVQQHQTALLEIKTTKKIRSQMARWIYKFAIPVTGALLTLGAALYQMEKLIK